MQASLEKLVEEIDATREPWSTYGGGDTDEHGVMQMPDVAAGPVAMEAMDFLYKHNLMVDFDWPNWTGAREFFGSSDPKKFETLGREEVLKLLTAVARSNRFVDGSWAHLFERGDGQKLFHRLLSIEKDSSA